MDGGPSRASRLRLARPFRSDFGVRMAQGFLLAPFPWAIYAPVQPISL
jgi:hypothetical protein